MCLIFSSQSLRNVVFYAFYDAIARHGIQIPVVHNFKPLNFFVIFDEIDDTSGILFIFWKQMPKFSNLFQTQKLHIAIFGHDPYNLIHAQHLRRIEQIQLVQNLQQHVWH